ncbi:uncharacterized protein C6orf62 homolog [Aplysia californica]|uniref:Uncharacterized protein C6orf62 homolog n=1 Tax=Aplysia californica TaxID=6500 RepID=A0ABM0JPF2_APLCA|nr:uncharacterized protein C6orf62 homolog [Aplysia californica]
MGDPVERKNAAVSRLRNNLRKKRESLADQFDFKMYISFHFKDEKKKSALFEVAEVLPVMTNNYEHSILQGVKNDSYSYESSRELIDKDVVQFHAHRWQPMRRDVIGCISQLDFFLWPRNDIENIQCHLYSRWKGEEAPFKPLSAEYSFGSDDYERQLMRLLTVREKNGLIVTNPDQTVFLFVDKHHLQTTKNKVMVYKLRSLCLYLPQDQLMSWSSGTVEDLVASRYL